MLRSTNYSQTDASTEPIVVKDIRDQLRLDSTFWDADLNALIPVVRNMAQTQLGDVLLIDQTCVDNFDEFGDQMELHYSPVDSVTTVKYYDTDGVLQTLSTDTWELRTRNGMGVVQLKYNQSWPTVRDHEDAVEITYTAGYGTSRSDVPQQIRTWMAMRAANLWQNIESWPETLDILLATDKTIRVVA